MDKVNLYLRRFDPCPRFLLEGMEHPQSVSELHCIDNAKCIASVSERYFEDPSTHPLEGLGGVGFPASRSDRQSLSSILLNLKSKRLKVA